MFGSEKSGKKEVASMFMSVAIGLHLLVVVRFGFPAIGGAKAAVAKDGSEAIGDSRKRIHDYESRHKPGFFICKHFFLQ